MSRTGGSPNVCFYSNKCKSSEQFIKTLKETPWKGEFQFICVDGRVKELVQKYPWLERTPTLVISGEDTPRAGNEAINWIYEKKLLSEGKGPDASGEVEPWIGDEMGGSLTKGFSFIGPEDTNDAPKGDFAFLNGQNAVSTKTASDMPGGGLGARGGQQKSSKERLFDKQYENFLRERSVGVNQPPMRQ